MMRILQNQSRKLNDEKDQSSLKIPLSNLVCDDEYFLHKAMTSMPPIDLDTIKTIIEQDPVACARQNDKGMLPLHLAAAFQPLNVVNFLLIKFPEATREFNHRNELPLHCALSYGSSNEAKISLILSDPFTCSLRNSHDQLPLHIVCSKNPLLEDDISLLSCLIECYPEACSILHNESYPLHQVISTHGIDAVNLVLSTFPAAATFTSSDGNYPLHLLMKHQGQESKYDVKDDLVKIFPKSVLATILSGILPISTTNYVISKYNHVSKKCNVVKENNTREDDIICSDGNSIKKLVQLSEQLLQLYPEALCKQNHDGMLPYHIFMSTPCSCPNTFIALLRVFNQNQPGCLTYMPTGHPIQLWIEKQPILSRDIAMQRIVFNTHPSLLDVINQAKYHDLNYHARAVMLQVYAKAEYDSLLDINSSSLSSNDQNLAKIISALCIDAKTIGKVHSWELPDSLLKLIILYL